MCSTLKQFCPICKSPTTFLNISQSFTVDFIDLTTKVL